MGDGGPDEQASPPKRRSSFWAFLQFIQAFGLAALIILPALDVSWDPGKRAVSRLGGGLRKLSLSQYWGMYAPEAMRSMKYIRVTAHYADGRAESLEENIEEEHGWQTHWFWTKNRNSIWRHRLTRENATRDRIWYLRGVCVRETRRTGETPDRVVMELVRRKVRSPEHVRAGKAPLGRSKTKRVQTLSCRAPVVRDMVAAALEEQT